VYLQETRNSYFQFLKGDPKVSIRHMRNAVQIALDTQMPNESIAWTQFTLGDELFQTGDLKNAEIAYQDALVAYPEYHRALAGLAKVRCAQGRFETAIELYNRALAVIPMPAYAAALGDLYTKIGRSEDAKKQYNLVEFIGNLSLTSQTVYNRELALFYADHDIKLKESLALAQKELAVRRDIYTWDALAWALYKNGKTAEAVDAISKALALGTEDALLSFHAGMIYHRVPNESKAREYLTRALATNAHFHVLYSAIAEQTLREIDKTSAEDRAEIGKYAH
jgi:tetratricopeptide (TPR) repeat protein